MKRTGRADDDWQDEARALHTHGMSLTAISRKLDVSWTRVRCLLDPSYAEARNVRSAVARRAARPSRSYQSTRPQPEPTERSIIRVMCDGTRISLPRVAWLERPMPGVHHDK